MLDIPDGKPKWAGLNESSELMNEVPSNNEPEPAKANRMVGVNGNSDKTEGSSGKNSS